MIMNPFTVVATTKNRTHRTGVCLGHPADVTRPGLLEMFTVSALDCDIESFTFQCPRGEAKSMRILLQASANATRRTSKLSYHKPGVYRRVGLNPVAFCLARRRIFCPTRQRSVRRPCCSYRQFGIGTLPQDGYKLFQVSSSQARSSFAPRTNTTDAKESDLSGLRCKIVRLTHLSFFDFILFVEQLPTLLGTHKKGRRNNPKTRNE